MTILDNLFYEAGGYSAKDLEHASDTERRQILQLGSAVIFSLIASSISWGAASTLLLSADADFLIKLPIIFISVLLVLAISLSFNRNLIFYSDMHEKKAPEYTYSSTEKGTPQTLPYLRIAMVLLVSCLTYQVFDNPAGAIFILVLALFELYPLLLKRQMGQTILGRRIKARLDHQHERGMLKKAQYDKELREKERKK